MSFIRVTQNSLSNRSLASLQLAQQRLQKTQEQLSSGKAIQKPSDSPIGTADALSYRADLKRTDQFGRNVSDAQGWLNTADSTLSDIIGQLRRARDLTLQGATSTSDSTARNAMAQELANIRDSILKLANTTYNGRQIFSETEDPSAAGNAVFDTSATYFGNTGAVYRTIGPGGDKLQVNVDGETVFGTAGNTAFDTLQTIFDHLSSGLASDVSALSATDIGALDTAIQRIQISLSTVGSRAKRADDQQTRLLDISNNTTSRLSDVEDVDIAKTIVQSQLDQVAYQAALAATAKVIQPSLMDFLN